VAKIAAGLSGDAAAARPRAGEAVALAPAARLRLAARLAAGCCILVFLITSLSAFLRLEKAGLGCEPWPQCYGEKLHAPGGATAAIVPPGEKAWVAAARAVHRIAASTALVLLCVMAAVTLAVRPRLWRPGAMTLSLIALAILLAILGRYSSGVAVPAVAIGNLLGGFAMLALAWRLRREADAMARQAAAMDQAAPERGGAWAVLTAVALLAQILLGAMVSGGYAGAACASLPDCHGTWWPQPAWAAFSLADFLTTPNPPAFPAAPLSAALHMAHRYGALAVLLPAIALLAALLARGRRRQAALLLSLLTAQIALGLVLVSEGLPLLAALAHNAVAAVLFAFLVGLV